tara:strand:+ start:524 stop:667 length:144 start_codon:yes stop_codon:yes gene_type:complete
MISVKQVEEIGMLNKVHDFKKHAEWLLVKAGIFPCRKRKFQQVSVMI